jgi:hypothetical protein
MGTPPAPHGQDQLNNTEVANFLATKLKVLNDCYEERLERGYAIGGNVGVRFNVSPQGYVQQMCLVEDATGDAVFIDCLFGEIGTWRFPERPEPTEIRHRWTFRYQD